MLHVAVGKTIGLFPRFIDERVRLRCVQRIMRHAGQLLIQVRTGFLSRLNRFSRRKRYP
jgi:hypothetical protein